MTTTARRARGPTIIINVDDLGLHPAVRRAVEACAARGTVTSASLLANGPDQDSIRPYQGISLGVHLNIVRGTPLSPRSEVPSLVGADGNFLGSFGRVASRLLRRQLRHDEVSLEWSRQVDALQQRGIELTHLDAEQHTHCLPGLFPIACAVAREHGIGWVRRSEERFGNLSLGMPALRRGLLRALSVHGQCPPGIQSADAVWGLAEQGSAFTAKACARALHGIGPRLIEVVCHPGEPHAGDPALPASFGRMRVQRWWEHELHALLDGSWISAAQEQGWRLSGFQSL